MLNKASNIMPASARSRSRSRVTAQVTRFNVESDDDSTREEKLRDFGILKSIMVRYASEHSYRRHDDWLYGPVKGTSTYEAVFDHGRFVNHVLRGHRLFRRDPDMHSLSTDWLSDMSSVEIPWFKQDQDLVSFANGTLEISTETFTKTGLHSRVAGYHIHGDYTGCADTPLLNQVLDLQFSREVGDVLLALIGRAMFNIGKHDDWNILLFLVGHGSGKSLILDMIKNLLNRFHEIRDGKFTAYIGRVMPLKNSARLRREMETALERWPLDGSCESLWSRPPPLIYTGKFKAKFLFCTNGVFRHVVAFRFDRAARFKDDSLGDKIIANELPNIMCRCLREYAALRSRVWDSDGLMDALPSIMQTWNRHGMIML